MCFRSPQVSCGGTSLALTAPLGSGHSGSCAHQVIRTPAGRRGSTRCAGSTACCLPGSCMPHCLVCPSSFKCPVAPWAPKTGQCCALSSGWQRGTEQHNASGSQESASGVKSTRVLGEPCRGFPGLLVLLLLNQEGLGVSCADGHGPARRCPGHRTVLRVGGCPLAQG